MAFSFNFDIPLQTEEETNDKEKKDDNSKDVHLKCSVREFIISLLNPAIFANNATR